jgi:hypothetical protein
MSRPGGQGQNGKQQDGDPQEQETAPAGTGLAITTRILTAQVFQVHFQNSKLTLIFN